MVVEALKGAGMAYQGSVSTVERRVETQQNVESGETATAAERIARETMALNTKETSGEGGGSGAPANQEKTNEQIKKAVEDINKKANNSEAVFGIHDGTNRVTIKIVDKQTKKVIKELPPEKTLDMIAKVWEMAGLMVDEKR